MNTKNMGEMTTVWEQRKLDDWGTFYYGRSCPKWSVTEDATIPCIRYGELYTKFGAKIDRVYSYTNMPPENLRFSKGTEVLIPRVGEDPMDYNHCTWLSMPDVAIGEMISVFNTENNPLFTATMFNATLQNEFAMRVEGGSVTNLYFEKLKNIEVSFPSISEQEKIAAYFDSLDHLITLHQCKYTFFREVNVSTWEQRKVGEFLTESREFGHKGDIAHKITVKLWGKGVYEKNDTGSANTQYFTRHAGQFIYSKLDFLNCAFGVVPEELESLETTADVPAFDCDGVNPYFMFYTAIQPNFYEKNGMIADGSRKAKRIHADTFLDMPFAIPSLEEQNEIVNLLNELDDLITLHHHKPHPTLHCIYIHIKEFFNRKEDTYMPELEQMIENKLIEQLVYGDSQWTYREDLKTEEDLWANFRYILEQNNKDRLNGEPLSDSEFEQVKNQLQFSSFYKAGEWLVGENGKVQVHVQRDTEKIHLVVMNHEHIAGGSSVYEVINQYSALKSDDDDKNNVRNRRFDVTLLINGLPMIHIELKNKKHSYMDAFRQIKKYIGEGKFTGIFSAVQMFVISNGVDTRYFSAASDTELNPKFMSCWLDKDNNPVTDYLEFAKNVLRIPEAHEMIARYTVLDKNAKRLILLRPYQIHAIEAIRDASKTGRSGFVWHTTGSGKTLTSYKATRNLLMDIPSIDKTIFLIDRKDLDTQTTMAFQAYANNDVITVDETNNVNELRDRLKSLDRTVIVTTIQKLQRLIDNRLVEGTPEYNRIKNLKIGFIVDECHRAVTPATKRELERFFNNSLWFGFTGTPRFSENPYAQLGDLPRTTEELYGNLLHKYTIQNAIHDKAVLGFQVEHNGPKDVEDETDTSIYESESHMLKVLDIILNKSYNKLGFQNGKGMTYEGLLTTSSIQMAQRYYELLKKVKNGETSLKIDEKIKKVLPDFPKFAITYSVAENSEGGQVNKEKMEESLNDYNNMFDKNYDMSRIQTYNDNLNKRLARKDPMYKSRHEQLDLVIVVDRLLTGFDAPCMSTIFIDRQPMGPHDLIQAFSRTNRIFDTAKTDGQVVTFQAPKLFKQSVDNAIKLYSAGGTNSSIVAEWDAIEEEFRRALAALRGIANTPDVIKQMSLSEKKVFVKTFQHFDRLFSQLKSFTRYDESMLADYNITEEEYDNYAGHYLNVMEEIRDENPSGDGDSESTDNGAIDPEYELMAYSNIKIDYEYIINLIQNIVTPDDEEEEITPQERERRMYEVKQYIDELRKDNPKVADIMTELINNIESDSNVYKGQSILNIVENMKNESIEKVITDFCINWYASKDDVMYAATHYRNGEIPNESAIKSNVDYTTYKTQQEKALPKFKYYKILMEELKKTLEEEVKPLIIR